MEVGRLRLVDGADEVNVVADKVDVVGEMIFGMSLKLEGERCFT